MSRLRLPPLPLRNSDAWLLFESFFVAAVFSVIGIRWVLVMTGFPRLGGGELHIAHMLWGGALMVGGVLLLLAYLDRPVQHVAAVIAGLGFGAFIDELGKFVTADNNYFFRPAVALIYVVFVFVFLTARTLAGRRTLTERESLANALDMLEVRLGEPLEADDRARIEGLLDQAGTSSDLVPALRHYLETLPDRPDEVSWWEAIPRRFARLYARIAGHPLFSRVLTAAVLLYAAAAIVGSLLLITAAQAGGSDGSPSFAALGQTASTLLGAVLIGRGVLELPASRVAAYRWFQRGILVWLLITQVFTIYESEVFGLLGLVIDLAAYTMLRYAISHEEARATKARAGEGAGAGTGGVQGG